MRADFGCSNLLDHFARRQQLVLSSYRIKVGRLCSPDREIQILSVRNYRIDLCFAAKSAGTHFTDEVRRISELCEANYAREGDSDSSSNRVLVLRYRTFRLLGKGEPA